MGKVNIEELTKLGLNRYEAVIIASQHSRILNSRRLKLLERMPDDPSIEIDSRKISMKALCELLEGRVKFKRPDSI